VSAAGAGPRPNPYVGPRAYQTGEQLYGRNRELADLRNLLIAERIVLLYSPSGAGKSSLIQAALLPELQRRRFRVLPMLRVGNPAPPALPPGANRYTVSVLGALESDRPPADQRPAAELAKLSLAAYLDERTEREGAADEVLIFDQFEEVLILDPTDQAAKTAFFAGLGDALRDRRRWALFALREDYLAGLDPYRPALPDGAATTFRLDLLGADAACQAIQEPARTRGVEFQDAAAAKLVDDLRRIRVQQPDGQSHEQLGPYVEPVQLQVVCRELWDRLPPDATTITETTIVASGSVDRSLAAYYAASVDQVAHSTGIAVEQIRDWVDKALITPQGIRGQVLKAPDASQGLDNRAIQALVDAHLVRAERRRNETWFELAHDRLIPPIREDNSRWRTTHYTPFQRQARLWAEQGQPNQLLLSGMALWRARRGPPGPSPQAAIEREFLAKSQRRELNRLLAGGLILVAFGLVAYLAVTAQAQRQIADQAQATAQAESAGLEQAGGTIVAVRNEVQNRESIAIAQGTALVLIINQQGTAVVAAQQSVTALAGQQQLAGDQAQAQATELAAVKAQLQAALAQVNAQATLGVATPNSSDATPNAAKAQAAATAAAIAQQAAAQQVARAQATAAAFATQQERTAQSMAATAEAARNVVATQTAVAAQATSAAVATLAVLQTTTAQAVLVPATGHIDKVYSVRWSPDGRSLVTASADGTARVWTAATGQTQLILRGHSGPVLAAVYSLDGKFIVTGGKDGTIRFWDATTGASTATIVGGPNNINSIAYSPKDTSFATAGSDKVAKIWSAPGGQLQASFRGHTSPVLDVAYNPDGSQIITTSSDNTAQIWDLGTGKNRLTLISPTEISFSAAWSPDGQAVVIANDDSLIRIWDTTTGTLRLLLKGHTDAVIEAAYSPDGSQIASASYDRTVRLWNATTGQAIRTWTNASQMTSVAWSPDGQALAAASWDGTAKLWNAGTGQLLHTLP